MLRSATIVLLVIAFVGSARGEKEPTLAGRPVDVWLIIDTSPHIKAVADELGAVATAAVKALAPGDRLWILSGHADRPRLRVVTTISLQDTTRGDLIRAMEDIEPAVLLNADLTAALQVPLHNIRNGPEAGVRSLVILLTDARFGNDQADRVLACVHELEAVGARVFCSGVDNANRKLLVAAAQGRLRWARLPECDPAKWIADARGPAPSATAPVSPPAVAQASAVTGEATPSPPPGAQEPAAKTIPAPSALTGPPDVPAPGGSAQASQPPPTTTSPPSAPEPPQVKPAPAVSPPPAPERPALPAPTPSASGIPPTGQAEVAATPPAPEPRPSPSAKRPAPEVPANSALRKPAAPAPLSSDDQSAAKTSPVEPPRQMLDKAAGGDFPSGPVLPSAVRSTADNRGTPAATAPTTGRTPSRFPDTGHYSLLYGALAVILILAAFLTTVLAVRRHHHSAAKRRMPTDDEKKVDRRELYAQVNGHEIALGPLAEVRRVDIGASSRATIPLLGDGLLPRHVLLRRDGEVFRLRNLAHKPIVANGVTVAPRGRARVVLPLDLALTDKTAVALRVRDQKGAEND